MQIRTKPREHRHRATRFNVRWALLPYGVWMCKRGRCVVFNRNYRPIWEYRRIGKAVRADPGEWVRDIVEAVYIYDDDTFDAHGEAVHAYELLTGRRWDWQAAASEYRACDRRLRVHSAAGARQHRMTHEATPPTR